MTQLSAAIQALPKVELHCHLLGAVRRSTFAALRQRELNRCESNSLRQAALLALDTELFYTRGEKPVGAIRVLRALEEYLLREPEDFFQITCEYLQDAAVHNVVYSEFFWNPTGCLRYSGLTYAQMQGAILAGIEHSLSFGITGRLIPSIDREATPQAALSMLHQVIENRANEVVGIGIDYKEVSRPPELFAETFSLAKAHGFKTTAHVGEFGLDWHNIQTAFERLEVDRLDHAYTVINNLELARKIAEKGTVITVAPTNSYYLRTLPKERWAIDHPIRFMPALGLKIHPNTDDPTLHHIDPTRAWLMMVKDFEFTVRDLKQFMLNGLDGAWIDDSQRDALKLSHAARFDSLFAGLY